MSSVIEVTDVSLRLLLDKASGPVLVDFWASWCAPCRQIAPVLEELADQFTGKVVIAKLNADDNPVSPADFGVRGLPTLILFRGGRVAAVQTGALPRAQLVSWITRNLETR